jgi:hypothetical protein
VGLIGDCWGWKGRFVLHILYYILFREREKNGGREALHGMLVVDWGENLSDNYSEAGQAGLGWLGPGTMGVGDGSRAEQSERRSWIPTYLVTYQMRYLAGYIGERKPSESTGNSCCRQTQDWDFQRR